MMRVFPQSEIAHPWRTSLAWAVFTLYVTILVVYGFVWAVGHVGPLHGWSFVPVTA